MEDILIKTLNKMPIYFSSNKFSKQAVKYGLPRQFVVSGDVNTFLVQNADRGNSIRTWVKRAAQAQAVFLEKPIDVLVKPPIGLVPKWMHKEQVNAERAQALANAIGRYVASGMSIDKEWIDEYIELKGMSILETPIQP